MRSHSRQSPVSAAWRQEVESGRDPPAERRDDGIDKSGLAGVQSPRRLLTVSVCQKVSTTGHLP